MRYSVLTYIFGDYECVHEVKEKDMCAEYILVTDNPTLKSETWTVICDDSLKGLSVFDKCYAVRFHPFQYVNTDLCVRIDGSIEIRKSLMPLINEMERGNYDRCLMIHPDRNTMPDEYAVWVKVRNYPQERATRCLDFMARIGYDFNYKGLFQFGFEIVSNNEVNRQLNDITYQALRDLGTNGQIERVDQTIFSMLANLYFSTMLKVLPVSQLLITDGQMMQLYEHKSIRKNNSRPTIAPMMFGRLCEVWK